MKFVPILFGLASLAATAITAALPSNEDGKHSQPRFSQTRIHATPVIFASFPPHHRPLRILAPLPQPLQRVTSTSTSRLAPNMKRPHRRSRTPVRTRAAARGASPLAAVPAATTRAATARMRAAYAPPWWCSMPRVGFRVTAAHGTRLRPGRVLRYVLKASHRDTSLTSTDQSACNCNLRLKIVRPVHAGIKVEGNLNNPDRSLSLIGCGQKQKTGCGDVWGPQLG